MSGDIQVITTARSQLEGFVERALIDFGLKEAFEVRPREERVACLRWIAEAREESGETSRVSELLDALDAGTPLPPVR